MPAKPILQTCGRTLQSYDPGNHCLVLRCPLCDGWETDGDPDDVVGFHHNPVGDYGDPDDPKVGEVIFECQNCFELFWRHLSLRAITPLMQTHKDWPRAEESP